MPGRPFTHTEGSSPVATRNRPMNPVQRQVLVEYVNKLRKLGVIEPIYATGGWLNPVMFVEKPDNTQRVCLDLRRTVNSLARPLVSSLPHMQDCVDSLAGAK